MGSLPKTDHPLDPHERLSAKIQATLSLLEEIVAHDASKTAPLTGYALGYKHKLELLRGLIDANDPVIVPEMDSTAPLGHACSRIEEEMELERGRGLGTLEELAELGLLRRTFLNKVHLCPECRHCQLNFRETCSVCGALELEVERMLHHFPCAYSGIESEFRRGLELVCPKCNNELRQLGQDFERPCDVYVCAESQHVLEEPELSIQCLNCSKVFAGNEVEEAKIFSYRPTHLAVRAVELNRLTGLDATDLLYDANLRLASHEFLAIEVRRELLRIERYGGSFVTVSVGFELNNQRVSVFDELPGRTLRALGQLFASALRGLDLVARTGTSLAILLIETDEAGALVVRDRLLNKLRGLELPARSGQAIRPVWEAVAWRDGSTPTEDVLAFFGAAPEVEE